MAPMRGPVLAFLIVATTMQGLSKATVCRYEGREYAPGAAVPTGERCLTCRCGAHGGAPLCRLQVCPELPVPPPRGCVIVHRRDDCCQRLVCEEPMEALYGEGRGAPHRAVAEVNLTSDSGCVVNGTRYADGSATDSSSLCEYCYCVRGNQRCVKPRCEMPLRGCRPRYRARSCCPVAYECGGPESASGVSVTSSTTKVPPRVSGCLVQGARHKEGAQVRSLAGDCERCYCLRGTVRCVKIECAPPLMGCTPVFASGRCCPVQYNCSRIMTQPLFMEPPEEDTALLEQLAEKDGISSLEARKYREMTENATSSTSAPIISTVPATTNKTTTTTTAKPKTMKTTMLRHNTTTTVKPVAVSTMKTVTSTMRSVATTRRTKPASATTIKRKTKPAAQTMTTAAPKRRITNSTVTATTTQVTTPKNQNSIRQTTTISATTLKVKLPTVVMETTTINNKTGQNFLDAVSDSKVETSTKTIEANNTLLVQQQDNVSTTEQEASIASISELPGSFAVTLKSIEDAIGYATEEGVTTEQTTAITVPDQEQTTTTSPELPPTTTDITTLTTLDDLTASTVTSDPTTTAGLAELEDRSDVLDLSTDTSTVVSTSTTTAIPTTQSPLLAALLIAKNQERLEDNLENEYGEALPPSLPNITMIPFLPEDAVVDKKKDTSYSSTESGVHYKGAVIQGFSPPSAFVGGFVPRQPPLLDDNLFYVTSTSPEVGDILTAPQASLASSMISLTTPTPENNIDSMTVESAITLANPSATKDVPLMSHIRVSAGPRTCVSPDGREVAHGDLMASPGPCELCRCDKGTVLCHEDATCAEKNKIQDRIDTIDIHSASNPVSTAGLENKNAVEEDEGISLDRVLDFLFLRGDSGSAATTTTPRPYRIQDHEPPPPPLPASMAGILKLAGCNIYGRMYRVGRIISELSGPCRECKCTELGVQCRQLQC